MYGHDLIAQDQIRNYQWTLSFYGYDGHGSVRLLTDIQGQVSDTYDYDAFGNQVAQNMRNPDTGELVPVSVNNAAWITANLYLYTGEQFDSDLGFYYLRARYHNPETGRFWTMDEYEGRNEDPPTLHKYLYCHANPVNGLDPSGRDSLSVLGAISIGLTLVAMSPTWVNAPGPGDVTYRDDGGFNLFIAGTAFAATQVLVYYALAPLVGKVMAKFWARNPSDSADILALRQAAPDSVWSGSAVATRQALSSKLPPGDYIFVIDEYGNCWLHLNNGLAHHSSLIPKGRPILAAGECRITSAGKCKINGRSGTYNKNVQTGSSALSPAGKEAFKKAASEHFQREGFAVDSITAEPVYATAPQ